MVMVSITTRRRKIYLATPGEHTGQHVIVPNAGRKFTSFEHTMKLKVGKRFPETYLEH